MKKIIFLAVIAALMMTSCSNDEVVEQYKGEEIGFNALMNNATRATPITSVDGSKRSVNFQVWAFDHGTINPYMGTGGVTVAWNGTKWDYAPKAYWPTGNLDFYGVSPETGTINTIVGSGTNKIEYTVPTDQTQQKDVMYSVVPSHGKTDGTTVNMIFKHALSQIVFKAKTTASNLTVDVKSVKICNVKDGLTYTLPTSKTENNLVTSAGTVTVGGAFQNYEIGMDGSADVTGITTTAKNLSDMGTGVLLLVPQTLNAWTTTPAAAVVLPSSGGDAYLEIECKIQNAGIYMHGSASAYAKSYVPFGADWKDGKKYIYTLIFGGGYDDQGVPILTPIEFTIDVEDWDEQTNQDIDL